MDHMQVIVCEEPGQLAFKEQEKPEIKKGYTPIRRIGIAEQIFMRLREHSHILATHVSWAMSCLANLLYTHFEKRW